MSSTPQPSRGRVTPSTLVRRWDALAAEQLRAELTRISAERDALLDRVEKAEQVARWADSHAFAEETHRCALQDQLDELLDTARRAGISLRVRPIGMTRDGQIGLMAGQVGA